MAYGMQVSRPHRRACIRLKLMLSQLAGFGAEDHAQGLTTTNQQSKLCHGLTSWQTAQGEHHQCTQQSPQGSSWRLHINTMTNQQRQQTKQLSAAVGMCWHAKVLTLRCSATRCCMGHAAPCQWRCCCSGLQLSHCLPCGSCMHACIYMMSMLQMVNSGAFHGTG